MNKKIAVITASWNTEIVDSGEASFIEAMEARGFSRDSIEVIKVPGSLEIPLVGKKALENGFDIAVGIGFVVNGGIYRHEFVGHTVVQSILDVQLQTGKPFLSVVLTPQAFNEELDVYVEMFEKHMVKKGQEAAEACARMLEVSDQFSSDVKQAA